MFSFFKSNKKSSPEDSASSSDEQPIPGPDRPASNVVDQDGFTVINHPNPYQRDQFQQSPHGGGLYPAFGGGGGFGSGGGAPQQQQQQKQPVHYLHGVPFKMSPDLCGNENSTEITRLQIDEILAFLTRTLDLQNDYEFQLERAIAAQ